MTPLGGWIAIPRPWLREASWLPRVARPGRVFVGPLGELLRVVDDGTTLERIVQGGRPRGGAAEDPDTRVERARAELAERLRRLREGLGQPIPPAGAKQAPRHWSDDEPDEGEESP